MSTVVALTDDQVRTLGAWNSLALEKMPYYASMLFSLRPVNAPGLETFAVDAQHRLYIDFDHVASWTPQLCGEALLHECGHLFYDHAARAVDAGVTDSERTMSNHASDAEQNDDLRDAGCAELVAFGITPKDLGCEDYNTYEHYLDALRKRRAAAPKSRQGQGGKPYGGCGSGAGGPAWDGELDPDDDLDGDAPGASGIEHERTKVNTAAQIRDYAAKGRGVVPGGMTTWAEVILTPPKVPWRQTLAACIRRGVAGRIGDFDATYSRRHRRMPTVAYGGGRIVRPGSFSPEPHLAVVRDTSGSMSDTDLDAATIEVEGIARHVGIRGRQLMVFDVDAQVHSARAYNGVSSIAERHGRGGTDMCVGIDEALKTRPSPSAIVVLTDGYTPWPSERLAVPLVICIIPNGEGDDGLSVAQACPDWAITVIAQD